MEKKYGETSLTEKVTQGFLGMGTKETLHGQPDCSVRGYVEGETELVSILHTEVSSESDGGTSTVD